LLKFYENNKSKVEVIAVSVDKDFKRYKRSADKYNIRVPHFYSGFTYANDIFNLNIKVFKTKEGNNKYMSSTPQYVLISPGGIIIDKDMPKPSSKSFKSKINHYLNEE
jgi:peroxiredoxin